MITGVTREQALDAYKNLVESTDQAVALLVVETKEHETPLALPLAVPEGVGMGGALHAAAAVLRDNHLTPTRVLLHSEAWQRVFKQPEDRSVTRETLEDHMDELEEKAMSECVLLAYASTVEGEEHWHQVTGFVRTNEGVRWHETTEVPWDPQGNVADGLETILGLRNAVSA